MLQKKTKYAIKALLALAKEYKDNKPMKISEIAESEGIPRKFLEAIMLANGCFVAVTNRIGTEKPVGGDGIEFWGQSFVSGTSGEILAKAGATKEEILLVPVDLGSVDTTRTHWPFLRDRRIDAYGDITKRYID